MIIPQPFSGPHFEKNRERCGDDETPCVLCGVPMKDADDNTWLWLDPSNSEFTTHEKARDDAACGAYPIGKNCLRKFPALKLFAVHGSILP